MIVCLFKCMFSFFLDNGENLNAIDSFDVSKSHYLTKEHYKTKTKYPKKSVSRVSKRKQSFLKRIFTRIKSFFTGLRRRFDNFPHHPTKVQFKTKTNYQRNTHHPSKSVTRVSKRPQSFMTRIFTRIKSFFTGLRRKFDYFSLQAVIRRVRNYFFTKTRRYYDYYGQYANGIKNVLGDISRLNNRYDNTFKYVRLNKRFNLQMI